MIPGSRRSRGYRYAVGAGGEDGDANNDAKHMRQEDDKDTKGGNDDLRGNAVMSHVVPEITIVITTPPQPLLATCSTTPLVHT